VLWVYWTTPSVAWNDCGTISECWSAKDVDGSGRGIFETLCPEGFQQNHSPGLDLNPADSHVKALTLSTTRFDRRSVIARRYREMAWSLSCSSVYLVIRIYAGLLIAVCADCSLCHSRVFDAWRYDSDNTVDEIIVTFWLHCARNSRNVLNSRTSPGFPWQEYTKLV